MKDVLRAIDREEIVTVLYRGKEKAWIVPSGKKSKAPKPVTILRVECGRTGKTWSIQPRTFAN